MQITFFWMKSSQCTFVSLYWPTSLIYHSWRWQEGHICYSQLQNKCFSGIFGPFLSPLLICSSRILPWRYHVAMWGEISNSHESCFPQVNYLWWKSLRRWSPSAVGTLWSVLAIEGHSMSNFFRLKCCFNRWVQKFVRAYF